MFASGLSHFVCPVQGFGWAIKFASLGFRVWIGFGV